MQARQPIAIALLLLGAALAARASEAETSATAGSSRFERDGTASASARYEGDVGFARTQSTSGRISGARGVAVGVDEEGLSLSVSRAIAPQRGPALATSFNLSIGRDGQVSGSTGLSVARGPLYRSATAGGQAQASRYGGTASAIASGRTDRFGHVRASTHASDSGPRRPVLMRRPGRRPVPRHHHRPHPRPRLVRRIGR